MFSDVRSQASFAGYKGIFYENRNNSLWYLSINPYQLQETIWAEGERIKIPAEV